MGADEADPAAGGARILDLELLSQGEIEPLVALHRFRAIARRLLGPYVIGLPAIAKTALVQVDGILGQIQAMKPQSRWIFQCRDVEICGTRESLDRVGPRAIHLKSGQYLLVPASDSDRFHERMGGLKLVDGKLVPRDTPQSRLRRAAESTLPDMTYLTVHVNARARDFCAALRRKAVAGEKANEEDAASRSFWTDWRA